MREMDQLDRRFEALMAQYRQSIAEPEANVNFMPRLWERIEARRSFAFRFRRLTQIFVGAAAVLCLLIAGVSTVMPGQQGASAHATYLDVLAEAQPPDNLAAQGIAPSDAGEAS